MIENTIKVNILIVDDNPGKLTSLIAALTGLDIEIVTANSGKEALRKLLVQDFALILLDVNMPIMNGFETAEMIRNRPRSEHIPILFITAERLTNDSQLQGYGVGAVDYILTPVSPQILRAKVAVFADLYRLREQSARYTEELLNKNERIERQNLMLEEASRMKSDFVAHISHELRTPLSAIIGFSELLKEEISGKLNDKQKEQVGLIYTSGQHLLSLINDLLDLSKIEAGKLKLNFSDINLHALLEETLTVLREHAAKHHIQLVLKIEPDLEIICGDERKLKQILYNLLANAIKFSNKGGAVLVTAQKFCRKNDLGQEMEVAEIMVKDNGIGIAAADMSKLFQPFSQLGRHYDGTGLGLVMVKRLVELHGGRVEVTSEVGKGSCFSFWIPLHHDASGKI